MKKEDCIVTITDGISPTSMPYNEFVSYRLKHYSNEKQILIQVFENGVDPTVSIPQNIEFYSVGVNCFKLFKIIRHLERKYNIKAFHIHEGKSVILFSIATLFLFNNKSVYTIHSTYRNYPFHNKLFCFIASLLAKRVICVSNTSYKYYPAILKRIRKGNVSSIQNGVDVERINEIKEMSYKLYENFTITYVARLVPLKRHHLLIDIISHIPDINLELIGKGPLEEELMQYVEKKRLSDRIHFTGLLPRENVYQRLKSTDIYVSTSSYEGLPIGLLEALACGSVCVVTDIEQHSEIADKCSSLITLPPEIPIWVEEIRKLMSMNKKDFSKIGKSNKLDVIDNFSLRTMHEKYNKIYNSL